MVRYVIILFVLISFTFGQSTVLRNPTVPTGTTKVVVKTRVRAGMSYLFDVTNSCSTGSSSCTTSLCSTGQNCMPSTTSGAGLVLVVFLPARAHIKSAYLCNSSTGCTSKNAKATFSLCPGTDCAVFDATMNYGNDAAYLLSAPAGCEFVTVNVSATQTSAWSFNTVEVSPPNGHSFSVLDSSGAGSNSSCTTCTFSQPTLTGTDLVFQFNDFNGQPAAGPNFTSPYITDQFANAVCLDCNTNIAPAMTQVSGSGAAWSWLALKTTAGKYTVPRASRAISIVNHSIDSVNAPIACSPGCAAFTIPSTTSGNLLRLSAIENSVSEGYISSVSGCGKWVVPGASLQDGQGYGGISAAYNLAAIGGCTSITVTMNKSVGNGSGFGAVLSYWELSKPSGPWRFDTSGCTSNASGTDSPSGQALTLNETVDVHAIFQFILNSGGVSGVTLYPWTNNGGNPTAYNGSTTGGNDNFGSDVVRLNTKDGSAPVWEYPFGSTTPTSVCADAYY